MHPLTIALVEEFGKVPPVSQIPSRYSNEDIVEMLQQDFRMGKVVAQRVVAVERKLRKGNVISSEKAMSLAMKAGIGSAERREF